MNTSRIRLGGLAVGLLVLAIATVALAGQGLPIAEAYDRGPLGIIGLTDSSAEASTTSESSAGALPQKPEKQRVQGLTLRYHDLGLGSPVSVQLVKDPNKGNVSSATVVGNGTFTVQTKSGEKDLGAKIELELNGSTKIAIHVSCSKDIDIGFFFADDKDKTIDAESADEFDPTDSTRAEFNANAALEIVSLEPVGVCDSFVPPPPPPEVETESPMAALPEAAPPTPTPTPAALGISALPEGGGLPPEGGGSLLPLLYILSGATAIVVVAATARRWRLSAISTRVIGTRDGQGGGWTWGSGTWAGLTAMPAPAGRYARRRWRR